MENFNHHFFNAMHESEITSQGMMYDRLVEATLQLDRVADSGLSLDKLNYDFKTVKIGSQYESEIVIKLTMSSDDINQDFFNSGQIDLIEEVSQSWSKNDSGISMRDKKKKDLNQTSLYVHTDNYVDLVEKIIMTPFCESSYFLTHNALKEHHETMKKIQKRLNK